MYSLKNDNSFPLRATHIAQNAIVDVDICMDWVEFVTFQRTSQNVNNDRMVNMDQTNVPFDITSTKTITRKGTKSVCLEKI